MVHVPPRLGINFKDYGFLLFQIARNHIFQYFSQSVIFHSPNSLFCDVIVS